MNEYVITISRGFGSGGRTIGQKLAAELNIPYYDNEIIRLASEESGIHERLFGQVDEKLKNSIFRMGRPGAYKGGLISPNSSAFVSDDNLFNYEAKIIKTLAEKESCVIVGHCADFVLKDNPNTVNLFVYAPMENCLRNIVELYGVNEKEARKLIVATDRARCDYYKYYTGHDWDNARNYDLSLNSAKLGFDNCVKIVNAYLQTRMQ